jgi:diaminopimelate epimerase
MINQFSASGFQFPIRATKMSGTGNDFLIIDHRKPFIDVDKQPEFAKRVCRRKFSAGADGLILIENSPEADFRWQFYNADGSSAEMCGNGARCAARYAYAHKIAPAKMRFQTIAGLIEAEIVADSVKIKLTPPENIVMGQVVSLDGKATEVSSMNTGVPHVVCFVDDVAAVSVDQLGRSIRFNELFQPAGTNVNFVQVKPGNRLQVRTYERGVEGETLACGTGAVAAALISAMGGRCASPVLITTSGGEELTVHFSLGSGNEVEKVFLEGPAHFIYEAELTSEAFY